MKWIVSVAWGVMRISRIGFVINLWFVSVYASSYLIVANGPIASQQVRSLHPGRIMIALDGAALRLWNQDIRPDVVLGDGDSLGNALGNLKAHWGPLGTVFICDKNQDTTDLEKGIRYAFSQRAVDIIILGILGQGDLLAEDHRTDHVLSALSILKRLSKKTCRLRIYSPSESIESLTEGETRCFEGVVGSKIGIFGTPTASLKTEGLVWNINPEIPLTWGGRESVANALAEPCATITVHNGTALVISPMGKQAS